MDTETLTYLLRGGHISTSERIERGIWPHDSLKFSDLVQHLAGILRSEKWFPCEWEPAIPGKAIREGGVIERKSRFLYIYRYQRHHALNPTILAGQSQKYFVSSRIAARFYLKWDLILPGNLDGWKVI